MRRVRPKRPVLLCNPWSGGGKVEQFGLEAMADELGVETVFLDKGLDLAELARDAIGRGADCLGMAGGDGSQALVASIAHEHDIPFVCISAGTRNHFAQDLGIDKEDPRKGMIAFRDGVERFIDYGTVGDRLFVNNVSTGHLRRRSCSRRATATPSWRRRCACFPELLSRQAEPFDLQFTTPDGDRDRETPSSSRSRTTPMCGLPRPSSRSGARWTRADLGVFAMNARERARGGRDRQAGADRSPSGTTSIITSSPAESVRGALAQRQGLRRHRRGGRRA